MPLGESKEDKREMDKLKYMLYKLMSRTLSLEEFGAWLYNDEYVIAHITDNELIFELMSLDLRTQSVMHELEKFCFSKFSREEFLIEVVRLNCEKILKSSEDDDIDAFIRNINHYHDWNDDYELVSQVYYGIADDWDLVSHGYLSKDMAVKSILEFAQTALEPLKGDRALQVLSYGIDLSQDKVQSSENQDGSKWFEFWK